MWEPYWNWTHVSSALRTVLLYKWYRIATHNRKKQNKNITMPVHLFVWNKMSHYIILLWAFRLIETSTERGKIKNINVSERNFKRVKKREKMRENSGHEVVMVCVACPLPYASLTGKSWDSPLQRGKWQRPIWLSINVSWANGASPHRSLEKQFLPFWRHVYIGSKLDRHMGQDKTIH